MVSCGVGGIHPARKQACSVPWPPYFAFRADAVLRHASVHNSYGKKQPKGLAIGATVSIVTMFGNSTFLLKSSVQGESIATFRQATIL